jgi:threonine/homoserine/homoserine lactone efflux protein
MDMQILQILGIIAALALPAVAAPGPDYFLITRISILDERAPALRAVLGIATGVIDRVGGILFIGLGAMLVFSGEKTT